MNSNNIKYNIIIAFFSFFIYLLIKNGINNAFIFLAILNMIFLIFNKKLNEVFFYFYLFINSFFIINLNNNQIVFDVSFFINLYIIFLNLIVILYEMKQLYKSDLYYVFRVEKKFIYQFIKQKEIIELIHIRIFFSIISFCLLVNISGIKLIYTNLLLIILPVIVLLLKKFIVLYIKKEEHYSSKESSL